MSDAKKCHRKFIYSQQQANIRQLEWSISEDTYYTLISRGCYYCSRPLLDSRGVSLDRIDNSIGYVVSNVVPCCKFCNVCRNRFLTHTEMKLAMQAVLRYRRIVCNRNIRQSRGVVDIHNKIWPKKPVWQVKLSSESTVATVSYKGRDLSLYGVEVKASPQGISLLIAPHIAKIVR